MMPNITNIIITGENSVYYDSSWNPRLIIRLIRTHGAYGEIVVHITSPTESSQAKPSHYITLCVYVCTVHKNTFSIQQEFQLPIPCRFERIINYYNRKIVKITIQFLFCKLNQFLSKQTMSPNLREFFQTNFYWKKIILSQLNRTFVSSRAPVLEIYNTILETEKQ